MGNKLIEKLKKNSVIKEADVLSESKFFVDEYYDTGIAALNIAMSGRPDRGYSRGSTLIGGESATFKTMFMLQMASAHLKNFDDSVFVFYDIEFGTNQGSFEAYGIDTGRVLHKPFRTIEELTLDIAALLESLDETDNVIIGIDSLGAASTNKSVEDAQEGKTTKDMTKARLMKNFWQIVNPQLNVKKIPMFAIGQVYDTMDQYSPAVFAGGKAMYYYPNNRWYITKSVVKDTVDGKVQKIGSSFKVTVQKSRLIKEGSAFPVEVTFEGGINKYSALLEIALKTGHVYIPLNDEGKESKGYYSRKGDETEKKWRRKALNCKEFWRPILDDKSFSDACFKMFELGSLEENVDLVGEEEEEKPAKKKSAKKKDE